MNSFHSVSRQLLFIRLNFCWIESFFLSLVSSQVFHLCGSSRCSFLPPFSLSVFVLLRVQKSVGAKGPLSLLQGCPEWSMASLQEVLSILAWDDMLRQWFPNFLEPRPTFLKGTLSGPTLLYKALTKGDLGGSTGRQGILQNVVMGPTRTSVCVQ